MWEFIVILLTDINKRESIVHLNKKKIAEILYDGNSDWIRLSSHIQIELICQ